MTRDLDTSVEDVEEVTSQDDSLSSDNDKDLDAEPVESTESEGKDYVSRSEYEELSKKLDDYEKDNTAFIEMRKDNKRMRDELREKANKKTDGVIDEDSEKVLEKAFESYVEKKGVVTQDQLRASELEKASSLVIDEFLTSHPEYNTDEMWSKVKGEYSLYKKPETADGYRAMLHRIHKTLSEDDSVTTKDLESSNETRSKLASGSGGSKSTSDGSGVSESLVTSLKKKYPKMSKEQIKENVKYLQDMGYEL